MYEVVLDERALLRWPGDASVMEEQAGRLVDVGSLSTVDLRLLVVGGKASAVALAPFVIYEFTDETTPSVVLLESQLADTYLSAAEDVEAYGRLFDVLAVETMTAENSGIRFRSMQRAATVS